MGGTQWYESVQAPEALAGFVACLWTAAPSGVHRLIPDACVDLVCLSNGQLVLCGPELHSWTFQLPANMLGVGARFLPGVLNATFGVDMATICNRRVPAAEVFGEGHATQIVRNVEQQLADGNLAPACEALGDVLASFGLRSDRTVTVLGALTSASPSIRVSDLAATLAMSERQLRRLCNRLIGYGPSTFTRIVRFHRFADLVVANPHWTIASLSAAAGYHDQSHLVRDCQSIARCSPTAFLRDWFPTFPDRTGLLEALSHQARA